jgi:SAM-dependent methyltransferase
MTNTPLATERFSNRVADYLRGRPGYPGGIATLLGRAFGLGPRTVVVDVGCGTGLSCLPFLAAGWQVIGVEPNAAMRAAAVEQLRGEPRFAVRDGLAEASGVPAASADLLVAGQSFHWFDPAAARREALRVLRRPAHAALFWNERRVDGSPLARGYGAVLARYAPPAAQLRHRAESNALAAFLGAATPSEVLLDNPVALDLAGLLARAGSTSYLPAAGTTAHAAMCEELAALFAAHARDGRVIMEHDTRVVYAALQAD